MADKISINQRALPEVMSQRYLKSAIYPSQCNVEKTDRNGLHFMTGASLWLGPGKKKRMAFSVLGFLRTVPLHSTLAVNNLGLKFVS